MRNVRTLSVVSRPMLLGLAALLWGGCGVGPEEVDTASELQVQQAALLPDPCAPAPANHTPPRYSGTPLYTVEGKVVSTSSSVNENQPLVTLALLGARTSRSPCWAASIRPG